MAKGAIQIALDGGFQMNNFEKIRGFGIGGFFRKQSGTNTPRTIIQRELVVPKR
jgi:hypothetical protein